MASCHLPGHMQTLKAVDNSGSEGKTRLPRVTGWDEEEEAKAPENGPSQKETHLPTIHFQGQAVSFGEGILTTKFKIYKLWSVGLSEFGGFAPSDSFGAKNPKDTSQSLRQNHKMDPRQQKYISG